MISSDFFSSIEPMKKSIHCEYCGLRYLNTETLNKHKNFFCIGRASKTEIDRSKNNSDNDDETDEDNKSSYASNKLNKSNNSLSFISKRVMPTGVSSQLKTYVIRLRPNQDLFKELDKFVKDNDLKAAFIMTCVGSLTKATLRMAFSGMETNEVKIFNKHMEIVSLVGTLSSTGGHHLHISLSDANGHVFGGHVFGELNVFTTAEIVIGECVDLEFKREFDNQSGFDELEINSK